MSFTPRTTAPTGTALNTYWNAFTGECVWYTIGRIREVAGTPKWDPDRAWPVTLDSIQEAKQIYPNADEDNGWIKDGNTPSLGAIACWTGTAGHCMNVEAINGNQITLSGYNFPDYHSFALLTYDLDTITNNRISGLGAFQGFVRNPYVEPGPGPEPPEPPEPTVITPFIDIDPSSYNVTMGPDQDTVDFTFIIVIEGIPAGYTAGGNTYPGLTRIYNTGWSYTDYTGTDGNTYRQAVKTQTLQYARESLENYTVTKHMYYDLDYPNGSIHTDTPMTIHVEISDNLIAIILKTDKENEYMIKLI